MRRVISPRQLPVRLPLGTTAWIYLLLDRWQASAFVWGLAVCCVTVLWIVSVVALWTQHTVRLAELSEEES
jgi:hypothetical protein